ncbi:MAG: hypothetical protein AB1656_06215 [Candidatus Omnitrophota bacterium]
MTPIVIRLAVEDDLSEAALRRILDYSNRDFLVNVCYGKQGVNYLKKHISAYNHAAKIIPYLVLADLDRAECPPALIQEWLIRAAHPNLLFRVAVREVEAWLLADGEGIADYFHISPSLIPRNVEEITDPKQTLINLAKKSRKKDLREAIVPPHGSARKQGPDYNGAMIGFVEKRWNIDNAVHHSISLERAYSAIKKFTFMPSPIKNG